MSNLPYNDADLGSVLSYAKKLVGKSINDLLENPKKNITIKNKGIIGNIIETYFNIKQNSSPEPDFEKIGVELKVIPLIKQKKRLGVKERTKVCSIDYKTLIDEVWDSSHAKKKLQKILFIYYLYDKSDISKSVVKKVELWELEKDSSSLIIQDDWENTKKKVLDGLAHKLSEKNFKILSPARSGSGGVNKDGIQKDLVLQPNQQYEKKALKRAFTLKQSFTNQLWNELNAVQYESILQHLKITSMKEFEDKILKALRKLRGKSIAEISELFNIEIPKGKNQVATIIKKAIGFKSVNSKIKEFEQLGILVKTIKVRRSDNMPLEAVSFSTMKLQEFEKEIYENSTFKEYIQKILFIPIYHESSSLEKKYFGNPFFWEPDFLEEQKIKIEWERYQNEVLSGACKVKQVKNNSKKGFREISNLSKESNTEIIHMRPHGRDSSDRDKDSLGNSIVKQCFWLNKKFLQKLIEENQR